MQQRCDASQERDKMRIRGLLAKASPPPLHTHTHRHTRVAYTTATDVTHLQAVGFINSGRYCDFLHECMEPELATQSSQVRE